MSEELKPCPFCGGDPVVIDVGYPDFSDRRIGCMVCSFRSARFTSEAEAVTAWNTRTDPQTIIADAVKARGYWEGWTPAQIVSRQFVKLVEEMGEVEECINYPKQELLGNDKIGDKARQIFDDKDLWHKYSFSDRHVMFRDALKSEMADCAVVLLNMAAAVAEMTGEPFDLIGAAVEKATKDISRGVR